MLSNEIIYILVKLLHADVDLRFQNIADVRVSLETLLENIAATPINLRAMLGHPILKDDEESFKEAVAFEEIHFREASDRLSEFSLKYMGKFLYGKRVERLGINGGYLPLETIRLNEM